ncbi:MAG: hypothetical protein QOK46_1204, partial [Microbacteriaceae bacterium]|nr:hypothetical protein [Microbacteriaceae bacterium]
MWNHGNVEPIAKERDRLLQRSARVIGLGSTIVALICFSVPGVLPWTSYLATLPLFALLFFSLVRIGIDQSLLWVLLGLASGLAILVVSLVPNGDRNNGALASAMVPLTAGLASFAIVLMNTIGRRTVLLAGLASSLVLVEIAAPGTRGMSEQGVTVLVGWIIASLLGYWLSASVPRAARRIFSIGRAHRAERQASETEAQRRQGARLLHDTVLATLTLLAHSGLGVTASAL